MNLYILTPDEKIYAIQDNIDGWSQRDIDIICEIHAKQGRKFEMSELDMPEFKDILSKRVS
jgi:hypothetical protein